MSLFEIYSWTTQRAIPSRFPREIPDSGMRSEEQPPTPLYVSKARAEGLGLEGGEEPPLSCRGPVCCSTLCTVCARRWLRLAHASSPAGLPWDPAGRFGPYSPWRGNRALGGLALSEGSTVTEPRAADL